MSAGDRGWDDLSDIGSLSSDEKDKDSGSLSYVSDDWQGLSDGELIDAFVYESNTSSVPHIDVFTCTLSFAEEHQFTSGVYTLLILLLCAVVGLLVLGLQLDVARAYDISKATEALFLQDIGSVATRPQLWNWLETVWVPALFSTRLDINGTINSTDPSPAPITKTTEFIIQDQNKVALAPTLRQYRYRQTGCSSLKTFMKCLQPYSYDPFRNHTFHSGRGFVYTFRVNADEVIPPNEYVNVSNLWVAQATLAKLKNESWIDRSTAFVVAQSVMYNPHFQLVTNLRVVFVLTRTGQVIPYARAFEEFFFQHLGSSLKSTRLNLYDQPLDFLRAAFEVIYILITVGGTVRFVRNGVAAVTLTGQWQVYLSPKLSAGRANLLDLALITLSYCSIFSHGYFLIKHAKDDFSNLYVLPANFSTASRTFYFLVTAVMVMIFTLRLLTSIHFHPPWRFLTSTLAQAGASLLHFVIIFLMLLWFYSFVGYYYFGHNLAEYRGIWRGVETLLTFASSGQTVADVSALSAPGADVSAGIFPALFYWSFVVVVVLVLINMFLAIILGANQTTERRVLPQRRVHKKLLRPVGGFILDLLQRNGWIDVAETHYPLARCKLQYSGDELTFRLPLLGDRAAKTGHIYFVLPSEWGITGHSPAAQWVLRGVTTGDGTAEAPLASRVTVVFRDTRTAQAPLVLRVETPAGNWHGYAVTVRLGLRSDSLEELLDQHGEAPVYWTRGGQLAVIWGLHKEDVPALPLRALVTVEELTSGLQKSGLALPKRVTWDSLLTYCRKSFSFTAR